MQEECYDVVVVGMGVFGSATAHQLSQLKQTPRTLCLEQFNLSPKIHSHGSSHGNSRIIRFSYEEEIYSLMGIESLQQWRDVEKDSSTKLYVQTGGLDFGSESNEMMQKVIQVAKNNKLEHEVLNSKQLKERFPAFNTHSFQNDYIGLYQPDAGILDASECVYVLQQLALRNKNITMRDGQVVTKIVDVYINDVKLQRVFIQHGDQLYSVLANKVVLCVGSWTGPFLENAYPGVSLNLNIIQTSYGFWKVPEQFSDCYQIGKLPLWIHWGKYFDFMNPEDVVHVQEHSNDQELAYFGFPIYEKKNYIKAGIHYSLQSDDKLKDPTIGRNYTMPERKINIMKQYLTQNYAGMNYNDKTKDMPFDFDTCLYTTSDTGDFIIDVHPTNSNIVVCGACNGHAFKFAVMIGRMATELIRDPVRETFTLLNSKGIPREKFAIKHCVITSKL
ncbi:peroxisomal sarcosine oxidase [Acrasis kona]|uniref:Peroxisomal sarcosine oxidase n=1 Tax=Acrasis kona TaxID=1008807 RepID=A0AAW2Z9Y4_9EUKA